ncbi:MAG: OmpW family outer membrane protein [Caulobacteraceae bacterium]|nr:OmpW family outer membrane protein [Caulobacteraceae bacterium]
MNKSLFAAAGLAAFAMCSAAYADDFQPAHKGTWIVDVRASGVLPSTSDAITTAAGANTGLHVHVTDDYKPTLGFTYFIADHFAIEAILGTSHHEIRAQGPGTDILVRDTWVLPPVVTLQYRPAPASRLNPYVGAGVNYMLFYSGSNKNGFKVKTPSGFGYAVQAGADIAIKGPWTLNADVKKVFFETDAKINDGALRSKVNLDPWVVSVGFGRKF